MRPVLLVGHRGTGKTTTAHHLASLGWRVLDLDEVITQAEGMTPAAIIARSEARFRALERAHLARLISAYDDPASRVPTVIVPGAGCTELPLGVPCVWLRRDGWARAAREERARLRPGWTFEEEVRWMRETREPQWVDRAHVALDVARGSAPGQVAARVDTIGRWLSALREGEDAVTGRTWCVPASAAQLPRAVADARAFGLAGVELRSDFFVDVRDVEAVAREDDPVGVLASLRHDDPEWLRAVPGAAALDVDLAWLEGVLQAQVLDALTPRPLFLSSHPVEEAVPGAWDALREAAAQVCAQHPAWAEHVVLKYAPTLPDLRAFQAALTTPGLMHDRAHPVTFLPQGEAFAWTRPVLLARGNVSNYVPVGLAPHRVPLHDAASEMPTPWDLQDWLPHLVAPAPTRFDALIGDPVRQSVGDVWHRAAALRAETPERGYLKVPVATGEDDEAFEDALLLLRSLGVRGLSVTAPHKRRVMGVVSDVLMGAGTGEVDAVNTLCATPRGWVATDTDEAGMRATLAHLEASGVTPGAVAIIGRGGVSPAVTRALEGTAWHIVCHASAREGWREDAPERVALVINAAGSFGAWHAGCGAPACDVWLDLHYAHVAPPPPHTTQLNGDVFFDAQARAQRVFWDTHGGDV